VISVCDNLVVGADRRATKIRIDGGSQIAVAGLARLITVDPPVICAAATLVRLVEAFLLATNSAASMSTSGRVACAMLRGCPLIGRCPLQEW
jgi:hypothetical protein